MPSIFDQTDQELSQELNKKSNTEIQKQTEYLGYFLKLVAEAVAENKSVKVENIVREVVGKVAVERPEWIKELKQDTAPIQKKLDYIASAIIRKEVVKEVGLKRPDWIKELIPKEIKFPEAKEAEKLIPVLKEVIKEIQDLEFPEEVSIKGQVEVKEPKWLKFPDIEKPILSLATFIKKYFDKTTLSVKGTVEINNPVTEITVKNPQKEVKITNLEKLEKNTELMTAQLQALGNTGSNGGGGIDTSSLATEETLQASLKQYITQALDDATTANVSYVCKMNTAGTWLFLKIDETGAFPTFTFANVSNNPTLTTYALAYAARTTATYGLLNTLTI